MGAFLKELRDWNVGARPVKVNMAPMVQRNSGKTYFGRMRFQNMPILVRPGPNPCSLSSTRVGDEPFSSSLSVTELVRVFDPSELVSDL